MEKIKVSADTVLSILKGIMQDEDVNYKIDDKSAPYDWQGKTVSEVLNIEYYTFKHRPMDTETIIRQLISEGKQVNSLLSLERSFCLLYLDSVDRVFSKDNDIVTVSASLEYWLQTEKAKLLEDLVEDMSIATCGIRIPVQINDKSRTMTIVFSSLNVSEIQEATEFGEMAVCELSVDIIFQPDIASKSDYTAEFLTAITPTKQEWVKLPLSSISFSVDMTQKSVPRMNNPSEVGSINLSKVKSMVLVFDGYKNNAFIDNLIKNSLASDYQIDNENLENVDINEQFIMKLTRDDQTYYYNCVVKSQIITIQDDTGNETHSLTLTTRGI